MWKLTTLFRRKVPPKPRPNYVRAMELRARAAGDRLEAQNPRHYPEVQDALLVLAEAFEHLAHEYEQGTLEP